jgi:hypothetical protein
MLANLALSAIPRHRSIDMVAARAIASTAKVDAIVELGETAVTAPPDEVYLLAHVAMAGSQESDSDRLENVLWVLVGFASLRAYGL